MSVSIAKLFFIGLFASLFMGCNLASTTDNPSKIPLDYVVFMEPYVPTNELQINHLTLSQVLFGKKWTNVERSALFVQRAEIEQRLGLKYIAMLDLQEAVKQNPENALAYYEIAGLLADGGHHLEAYDAYDAAKELSPTLAEVHLFRSIALYYGHREKMAYEDLKNYFVGAKRDPYTMLWMYIMEYELLGATTAYEKLAERFRLVASTDKSNFTRVIKVILGFEKESNIWAEMKLAAHDIVAIESLCELYFFLGKYHQLQGQKDMAEDYFYLSLYTNVSYFVEYACAKAELRKHKLGSNDNGKDIVLEQ